jgi:hypothetical protein
MQKPITVSAVLWEASDYSKLLAVLGDVLSANSGKVKDSIVGQLPYQVYPPNYADLAGRASARAEYIQARSDYLLKVSQIKVGNAESCKAALNAWATMVSKSSSAGQQAPEVNSPPRCL